MVCCQMEPFPKAGSFLLEGLYPQHPTLTWNDDRTRPRVWLLSARDQLYPGGSHQCPEAKAFDPEFVPKICFLLFTFYDNLNQPLPMLWEVTGSIWSDFLWKRFSWHQYSSSLFQWLGRFLVLSTASCQLFQPHEKSARKFVHCFSSARPLIENNPK